MTDSPYYKYCTRCGEKLPCIRCAIEYRRSRGLVGKEPKPDPVVPTADGNSNVNGNGNGPKTDPESMGLAPEVDAIAKRIREEGFVDMDNRPHEPWSDREYLVRAGITQDYWGVPELPMIDDTHLLSERDI